MSATLSRQGGTAGINSLVRSSADTKHCAHSTPSPFDCDRRQLMDRSCTTPPSIGKGPQSPAAEEEAEKKCQQRLEQLKSHPLFGDLQMTLALDCLQSNVPFSLLTESHGSSNGGTRKLDNTDTAFCTVSDRIVEQHVKLQSHLLGLRSFMPSLLAVYQQITEQVESQRYRALTYNCYSNNVKHMINWFYDSERQLLIDRIQESVNAVTGVENKSVTAVASALPKLNSE